MKQYTYLWYIIAFYSPLFCMENDKDFLSKQIINYSKSTHNLTHDIKTFIKNPFFTEQEHTSLVDKITQYKTAHTTCSSSASQALKEIAYLNRPKKNEAGKLYITIENQFMVAREKLSSKELSLDQAKEQFFNSIVPHLERLQELNYPSMPVLFTNFKDSTPLCYEVTYTAGTEHDKPLCITPKNILKFVIPLNNKDELWIHLDNLQKNLSPHEKNITDFSQKTATALLDLTSTHTDAAAYYQKVQTIKDTLRTKIKNNAISLEQASDAYQKDAKAPLTALALLGYPAYSVPQLESDSEILYTTNVLQTDIQDAKTILATHKPIAAPAQKTLALISTMIDKKIEIMEQKIETIKKDVEKAKQEMKLTKNIIETIKKDVENKENRINTIKKNVRKK